MQEEKDHCKDDDDGDDDVGDDRQEEECKEGVRCVCMKMTYVNELLLRLILWCKCCRCCYQFLSFSSSSSCQITPPSCKSEVRLASLRRKSGKLRQWHRSLPSRKLWMPAFVAAASSLLSTCQSTLPVTHHHS